LCAGFPSAEGNSLGEFSAARHFHRVGFESRFARSEATHAHLPSRRWLFPNRPSTAMRAWILDGNSRGGYPPLARFFQVEAHFLLKAQKNRVQKPIGAFSRGPSWFGSWFFRR